jgi:hypothetical protein
MDMFDKDTQKMENLDTMSINQGNMTERYAYKKATERGDH